MIWSSRPRRLRSPRWDFKQLNLTVVKPPYFPMRNSPERLKELHRLLAPDSQPERQFDEIAQRVAAALEVPFVMVNFLAD